MEILLTILFGIAGLLLGLPFLALALAKFNLYFTLTQEGSAKIVLLNGQFHSITMRYKGFCLDEKHNVRQEGYYPEKPSKEEEETLTKPQKKKKFRIGGLELVGFWPFFTIHNYRFRWTKIKRELKDGKLVKSIDPEDRVIDYILVQADVYYARLEGVETSGLVPVDMELVLTIRIVNPYRALFRGQDWFEYVVNRLLPYIREFCSGKDFKDLVKEKQHVSGKLYQFLETGRRDMIEEPKKNEKTENKKQEQELFKFTDLDKKILGDEGKTEKEIIQMEKERGWGILTLLREIYGIDVMGVEIDSIAPEARYVEIASKQWEADREAERIKTVYGKIITDYGESGLIIRYLESLDKAATKAGNWIVPFGLRGALSDLKGATGETLTDFLTKEEVTKEELKMVLEKIKEGKK